MDIGEVSNLKFKVEEVKSDIISLKLIPESRWNWFSWCNVTIDLDGESVSIFTARGNWQYKENKLFRNRYGSKYQFLKSLLDCTEAQFIKVIAKECEFDVNASNKALRDFLVEYFNDVLDGSNEEREEAKEAIADILSGLEYYWDNKYLWAEKVKNALDIYGIQYFDKVSGFIVTGYPQFTKNITRVFSRDIKPFIQRYIETNYQNKE